MITLILLGLLGGAGAAAVKSRRAAVAAATAAPAVATPIAPVQVEAPALLPDGTTAAQAALITNGPAQAAAAMAAWKVGVASGLNPGTLIGNAAPNPVNGRCPQGWETRSSAVGRSMPTTVCRAPGWKPFGLTTDRSDTLVYDAKGERPFQAPVASTPTPRALVNLFKPAITPNANTATGVVLKNTILAGLRGR